MALLKVERLSVRFGGLQAVDKLDLEIKEGEIRALIGPNGAGKTTVLNAISRVYQPSEGRIFFQNEDLLKCKPHELAQKGIARTFQTAQPFLSMTVLENTLVGQHTRMKTGLFSSALRWRSGLLEEDRMREEARGILRFVGLEGYEHRLAHSLPLGFQRRLELARALAAKPKLLLLDEPASGMHRQEIQELVGVFEAVRKQWGVSILLVEHNMRLVMGLSDQITVLNYGKKIAEGLPQEVESNPEVVAAYLGKRHADVASA